MLGGVIPYYEYNQYCILFYIKRNRDGSKYSNAKLQIL